MTRATQGYLMLAPTDNDWSEERIPEEWRDPRGRLKQTWRERVPQALWVAPDGDYATQPRQGAVDVVAGGAVFAVPHLWRVLHCTRTGVREAGLPVERSAQ